MTHDFQSARVLLRNPDPVTRKVVIGALANHGCRGVSSAQHSAELDHCLRSDMVDLLICDADLGLMEACDAVRQMRNRSDGDNTFALSIILTSQPDPDTLMRIIDSGADSILAKPFQPAALSFQIESLIRARRPFVVTSDYVGPERRGDGARPGTETAPRVAVPNPLRDTVTGAGRDELRRKVRAAWDVVNEHRIERQTLSLGWLAQRIVEAFQRRPPAPESIQLLRQLLNAAAELRLRVGGTGFDHVAHLATTVMDICNGLVQAPSNPDPRWLAALPKVTEAIGKAFTRERQTIQASRQISQAMSASIRSGNGLRSYH